MAFQTGFAVKSAGGIDVSTWDIKNADGWAVAEEGGAPAHLQRGDLIEVEDDRSAEFFGIGARVRLASGNYLVGSVGADELANDVVDLGAYAQKYISDHRKQADTKVLAEHCLTWIRNKQIIWWQRNAPGSIVDGQRARATGLVLWVERVETTGELPVGDIKLIDLDFEPSDQKKLERWDTASLTDTALEWIRDQQMFSWKQNVPPPFKGKQRVQATRLVLLLESADGTVQDAVPVDSINLGDLDYENFEEQKQERQGELAERSLLPLMSPKEAVARLATVDVIAPHVPEEPTAVVELAVSDDAFNEEARRHLGGSRNEQPEDVNGFTSRKTDPIKILLRPGAQGVGTEVHEMVHALSHASYRQQDWFFFVDEGITEYLTRLAIERREDAYRANYYFIDKLVRLGATDKATLAQLYFTGDSEGFDRKLRAYAGQCVSCQALRTVTWATYPAVLDYLTHLAANKTAPLD